MFPYLSDYSYIETGSAYLFTAVLLPAGAQKFPVVVMRSPYVDKYADCDEDRITTEYLSENVNWLKRGYAVVIQHCRGRGKSTGDCIPYINEREDGLALLEWIRKQPFYNGELYLKGGSYLTSVHYAIAPFPDDVKGAVFGIQDCERYNICYRNGFFKQALHGSWYVGMYKAKSKIKKNYVNETFQMLPLRDFTKTVFNESADDFDQMLKAPDRQNAFWSTRAGGSDARNAVQNVRFPVLFTTGFYDIYTGGIFDMWNTMNPESRKNCALVVSPYDHGDSYDAAHSIVFKQGKRTEQFGTAYEIDWFDSIRKGTDAPFEKNQVTYYRLFDNRWATDSFAPGSDLLQFRLGDTSVSYIYNPYAPPQFKGGLSCNFGGAVFQDPPNLRYDIITVYTDPFERDAFVKGKMAATLCVESDCEDTCFYMRLSIEKEQGDFGLRDDITSLCYQLGDYQPNTEATLEFHFDEHAFRIKKGERIRVDIASADAAHYVRHTNNKGLFSEQTTARVARNTVHLDKSFLKIPVESET